MKPWIALDWGTSTVRAWLVDNKGKPIEMRSQPQGVKRIGKREFPQVFKALTQGWLDISSSEVFACGMVGSSIGWKEAPYCKSGQEDKIANRLTLIRSSGKNIHLVPGLAYRKEGNEDVMRGEETALLGLGEWCRSKHHPKNYTVIIPGTHSKWVEVENFKTKRFTTFMTGELYEIITRYSVLQKSLGRADRSHRNKDFDTRSFNTGLRESQGGMSGLFKIRANSLLKNISSDQRSRISGLLIGDEIRNGMTRFSMKTTYLIGDSGKLLESYRQAFKYFKIKTQTMKGAEMTLAGLSYIKESYIG